MCLSETYGKLHMGKDLFDVFPIQNGLNLWDVVSVLLINFALGYSVGNVRESQEGLDLNWTCQLQVCADDVSMLGKDINTCTVKRNTDIVFDASKEVGLEVNAEKIMCIFISHHQNVEWNHNLKIAYKSLKILTNYIYLGMTVTNKTCIYEEVKSKLDLMNACYH